jgi:hypothetical protein
MIRSRPPSLIVICIVICTRRVARFVANCSSLWTSSWYGISFIAGTCLRCIHVASDAVSCIAIPSGLDQTTTISWVERPHQIMVFGEARD